MAYRRVLECVEQCSSPLLVDHSTLPQTRSEAAGTRLVLDVETLSRALSNPGYTHMSHELSRSWVYYPRPPDGMDCAELSLVLLSSWSYSMTPLTFSWSSSSDSTYESLWRLLDRISRTNVHCEFMLGLIAGRNSQGYRGSRGLPAGRTDAYVTTTLAAMPDVLACLSRESARRARASASGECVSNTVQQTAGPYLSASYQSVVADTVADLLPSSN